MKRAIVMTLIGPDRPGLVEKLAAALATHGGNWLESRMCRLGGEFVGLLRADLPTAAEADFAAALDRLRPEGLTVVWRHDTAGDEGPPVGHAAVLAVTGHDRPGIVREIAGALARAGANVEELETGCSSAPMSGEPLFHATAKVLLPPGSDLARVRHELERIAADLAVDIEWREPAPANR